MKYLSLNEYKKKNTNKKTKKVNKKKVLLISILTLIIILIGVLLTSYIRNEEFRSSFDKYVLRKDISENNLPTIEISVENTEHIYSYDRYIIVLEKNILKTYSSSGKQEYEIEVNINNPIFSSNNRFLTMAEQGGKKVYLISGQNIIWQKDLEGEVSKVNVNKNGYVSVVLSGTSYKNIIITYNTEGKELFKTYLSSTIAIDLDISNDNKYLAIAEIDTGSTLLQSNIKIISVENAISEPASAVIYIYPGSSNQIVRRMKYQDKNRLVCMYDNSINVIEDNSNRNLIELSDKKITFSDININSSIVKIHEKSSGLFADSEIIIMNVGTGKEYIYNVNGTPRSIYTYGDTVAINLGTEVHFVGLNGWLKKMYSSSQEIKNIVLGDTLAGIVYKNKIEIVSL